MKSMDKISTGIAYGTSAGSAGYWFLQWLDQVSPSQWAAIGSAWKPCVGLSHLSDKSVLQNQRRQKKGCER